MRTILFFLTIQFLVLLNAATAQQKTQRAWQTGCYYDLKGNKFIGWVTREQDVEYYFQEVQNAIFFKTVENSRGRKIPADSMQAYVAMVDSFVVIDAFGMKRRPFIRVIVDGTVKLYESKFNEQPLLQSMQSNGMMVTTGAGKPYEKTVYYYGTNPNDITQLKRSNFLKEMTEIFSSEPALLDEIKYQEYKYDDMDAILSHYFWYKRHEK